MQFARFVPLRPWLAVVLATGLIAQEIGPGTATRSGPRSHARGPAQAVGAGCRAGRRRAPGRGRRRQVQPQSERERYDVRMKAGGGQHDNVTDLDRIFLRARSGQIVRLDIIAKFKAVLASRFNAFRAARSSSCACSRSPSSSGVFSLWLFSRVFRVFHDPEHLLDDRAAAARRPGRRTRSCSSTSPTSCARKESRSATPCARRARSACDRCS